jgi:hypothetical protein
MRTILALGGAAVVLTAVPAEARHHEKALVCTKYRHGQCVAAHGMAMRPAMVHQGTRYRVGYVFGPTYGYTAYDALPHTYVTRYRLSPDYRYVYTGNTIYVVDPTTYAITRVLNGIVH